MTMSNGRNSSTLKEGERVEGMPMDEALDYRIIFNACSNGMAFTDYNTGTIIEVNDAWVMATGIERAESIGRRALDLGLWGDIAQRETCLAQLCRNGRVDDFEASLIMRSVALPHLISARIVDMDGRRYALWELRNIVERRQSEETLRESAEKHKLLLEATNTGFVILDGQGQVLDANQEYIRMTGNGSLENIIGRPVTDWTAPYDLERNALAVQECIATGSVRNLLIDYRDTKGRITPIEIHATVLPGIQGGKILTVCRDITERKQKEQEQERLKSQLTHAQKMESVGRLAGGVAHDFNNMLSLIIGYADLAMEGEPPLPLHAKLLEIRKAASRSADLTRQLLAFARKQTAVPEVLNLNDTVDGMLTMLRRLIGEDIDLAWRPDGGEGYLRIDPSQIDQILANLCINARDAISGTGKITIQTGAVTFDEGYCRRNEGFLPGAYLLLSVEDTGCGMDEETLGKVFEPFFTTKGVGKGTGLGLATVYGIVAQNNGFIKVNSEPGRGTTFNIYLPRVARPRPEQEHPAPEPAASGRETVLLVEDEPAILEMAAAMLNHLGYTTLTAAKPREAINMAQANAGRIHLLLTDVVMPEMNGRDLAEQLLSRHPNLRVLFMSGYPADVITHHGVLEQGVNFIQKPFGMNELAVKVRELLDSCPPGSGQGAAPPGKEEAARSSQLPPMER